MIDSISLTEISIFPTKDMQIPPPPLRFDPVQMKDAQCAESNKKSIFLIYIFRVIVKIHQKLG